MKHGVDQKFYFLFVGAFQEHRNKDDKDDDDNADDNYDGQNPSTYSMNIHNERFLLSTSPVG